jgi:nucleotide-binding universal stress UspA family protein
MIATRTGIADVLVIDDGGSPDWLLGWCRRSGRQMREIALPQPSGADLLTIADLVVTEAHNGTAVLVARPQPVVARAPRVVAALRDLPDDADVLALAAENAAHMGATLTVAHAVPASFGERSIGLSSALERGWRLLASVWPAVDDAITVEPRLLRLHPHELVGEELDADLLVVGGPRPRGGLGLVARSALFHTPCPVLFVPRPALMHAGIRE